MKINPLFKCSLHETQLNLQTGLESPAKLQERQGPERGYPQWDKPSWPKENLWGSGMYSELCQLMGESPLCHSKTKKAILSHRLSLQALPSSQAEKTAKGKEMEHKCTCWIMHSLKVYFSAGTWRKSKEPNTTVERKNVNVILLMIYHEVSCIIIIFKQGEQMAELGPSADCPKGLPAQGLGAVSPWQAPESPRWTHKASVLLWQGNMAHCTSCKAAEWRSGAVWELGRVCGSGGMCHEDIVS